ncbi:MAG: succinate dehydrogenase, cytochrome b556 subunit [Chloroflexi bacterium]|nr:succinate dehydrogenase, cytochrome b556 subunit [Chloroflexota bacterium]
MKTLAAANPAKYRVGMWAFVLHRLTGLVVGLYLMAHIIVISTAAVAGKLSFDNLMEAMRVPWIIVLELVLIAAVLYHLLNGVRLLLFDMGIGARQQKSIFWAFMVVGVGVMAWLTAITWPLIAG